MVHICRGKTQRAKTQLDLELASVVSDNKKGFFQHVNSKRKTKENIGLILVEDGYLKYRDEEKVELFLLLSLIILTDLGLSGHLSWSTAAAGRVMFHLWTLKL